ncbi:hypothetical protein DDZ13_08500 [Coraliomargarita sinensis]|uniref:Porin n=2 Tax=Coraliomargarita sinensis TaxID=2174842 RepID=A0A317ZLF2_9BACT|nr:hypothetical protein DDZ13_08500 [Coraliomargarita sinensis]
MGKELKATKAALKASEQKLKAVESAAMATPASEKVSSLEAQIANAADLGPAKITPGDLIPLLEGLKIGGAVRANYYGGDYTDSGAKNANRGDDGTISLDTFRINMDYKRGPWLGKLEYRFYPGYSGSNSDSYHFLHTGWLGYDFDNAGQLQVGVNRVPFGPGPYGISQSWFFDQHYYVGLSDDMDLGIKYTETRGDWTFDLAYYYSDEGSWYGENFSTDSVRYSYDVVDETGDGYEERNQFNARAIYAAEFGEVKADLGVSAQFGFLKSNGEQDDGEHYAFSVHPIFKWNNWTLAPQLTYYKYNIDGYVDRTDDGIDNPTDDLIQFGAYDFPTFVATEAWMPAISLSYYYEVDQVDWLDYIIPYAEYSAIMKTESEFNDSEFITAGAAWGRGGWYIYTELAFSNGNDFIGNEVGYGDPTSGASNNDGVFQSDRFGGNSTDEWETRFNVNFGYYF